MNVEEKAFQLILHGGDGRSYAMEAMALARQQAFEEAKLKIEASKEAINQAHHIQTELITAEAGGAQSTVTLLMVHAQDHLMNAMTVRELAEEIIYLQEELAKQSATRG
ncbi:PTS system, cellobiose-specific IIA component [Terribacillus halophilus]|uniref:PTS system, cellobiose-specific IIA component n=1 Tax=Terribacillus halophilus TaxID=361279 RepID=A0A1G6ISR9_9BACI|nr:PTS lactose/cellobiose transporter subunit IIA [Terribacillus halophilus]SDC09514.1 PTS system, cellobiose-specific IIA component [Terribacillus halophilus]